MNTAQRLFIVANRLPVSITEEKDDVKIQSASGGLVSAVKSYLSKSDTQFYETYWAGVPGCTNTAWDKVAANLGDTSFTYLPVMVPPEQYSNYYDGFSNSVLWPLFHYFPSFVDYQTKEFDDYMRVNEHFVEVLQRYCRENDVIWIHDYHLLPLAAMLRRAIPGITIGFFLHIPFPSFEVFRLLPRPWQEELLRGLLGADLIGFHTMDYAAHFLQSVQLILGVHQERNILRYQDRLVKVDVFPISIDYERFNQAYDTRVVSTLRSTIREKMNGWKVIFSVDRLDYTKGVQHRLRAYEYFLKQHPEWQGKVVFVMVVVPSRDNIPKYQERKRMIDELISRINGELGTLQWQPIYYQYNYLSFDEMVALYTVCDLALITPLRDGMNLVSKEFVASRRDQKGVLILSEMAGAAKELSDALIINPNDTVELAQTIKSGLTMEDKEQQARMEKMQKRIARYDVKAWAEDYMKGLENIKKTQQSFQEIFLDDYSKINLLSSYRKAGNRLLLLDYDGTLVSFANKPELAEPNKKLVTLLRNLGQVPGNTVFLISGRNSAWLSRYFVDLPINLIAEHGAKIKYHGGEWQIQIHTHSEWKSRVCAIMEQFERRCPHSFIEEKEFSMVWHFRNADVKQGKLRAMELAAELRSSLHDQNLKVTNGNKIVEVRNQGVDKGSAVKKVLVRDVYDFVFAVGDDETDEDMFKVLRDVPNCFSIKVGPNASYAYYNLLTPSMVVALLENMRHISMPAVLPLTA